MVLLACLSDKVACVHTGVRTYILKHLPGGTRAVWSDGIVTVGVLASRVIFTRISPWHGVERDTRRRPSDPSREHDFGIPTTLSITSCSSQARCLAAWVLLLLSPRRWRSPELSRALGGGQRVLVTKKAEEMKAFSRGGSLPLMQLVMEIGKITASAEAYREG